MNKREVAYLVLLDMQENDSYSDLALDARFRQYKDLDRQDKAYITYLVSGTIRRQITLDYIIDGFAKTKTHNMDGDILVILRAATYEMLYMDTPSYAVCDEAVDFTKKIEKGTLSGFVNAILRTILREEDSITLPQEKNNQALYLSIHTSHPLWLVNQWIEDYGYEVTKEICFAGLEIPPVTFCYNSIKTTKEDLMKALSEEGVVVEGGEKPHSIYVKGTGDMRKLDTFRDGLFHVMDDSAMEVVYQADIHADDFVIDVCGAPGGKSFLAAYLMEDTGEILSRDIYSEKINNMNKNIERLELESIETETYDGTKTDRDLWGKADVVLLDAPCSGFGLLRKKPEIKYNRTDKDIADLRKTQRELLIASAPLVKEEGTLVYSTCTLNKSENEEMVEWFTSHYPYEIKSEETIFTGEKQDGFYIAVLQKID